MRITATAVLCLLACTERASAQPDVSDVDWLRQQGADFERDSGVIEGDVSPIEVYATLDALADAEAWSCKPSSDKCLRTFWSGKLGSSGLLEAKVVGEGNVFCTWRLVVRSDMGWLASLGLGESPKGCGATLDEGTPEAWEYWFPSAVTQAANALRIEGQGQTMGEHWGQTREEVAPKNRVDHVVHLCRVEANVLACARESSPGRMLSGAGLTKADLAPLPVDPQLLPLSAFADPGDRLVANFVGTPARPGRPAHFGAILGRGNSRVAQWPLGDGRLIVVETPGRSGWDAGSVSVWFDRGPKLWLVHGFYSSVANEEIKLVGKTEQDGVVRISVERTNVAKSTLTWRWDAVFVAVDGKARAFFLPTGVTLSDPAGVSGGWWLAVDANRSGVRITEGDGPLAWFRETGRWSWAELEARIPRWQARIGKAIRQADALAPKQIQSSAVEGKEISVTLSLLPGYVEPLRETPVPHMLVLP